MPFSYPDASTPAGGGEAVVGAKVTRSRLLAAIGANWSDVPDLSARRLNGLEGTATAAAEMAEAAVARMTAAEQNIVWDLRIFNELTVSVNCLRCDRRGLESW